MYDGHPRPSRSITRGFEPPAELSPDVDKAWTSVVHRPAASRQVHADGLRKGSEPAHADLGRAQSAASPAIACVEQVIAAGVSRVAVSAAVAKADNPNAVARALINQLANH